MASFRRGLKSEANAIARAVRAELGIVASGPVNVMQLAEHLAIPIRPLSAFDAVERDSVFHFVHVDEGAFSGVTVFDGLRRIIVYNDAHAPTRQASDLAHEIAHALLQHPAQAALDERGCRIWPARLEEEADWLGGALLVSEEAALLIAERKTPLEDAARAYGVSPSMMRFRLNVTGADRRARLRTSRRDSVRRRPS